MKKYIHALIPLLALLLASCTTPSAVVPSDGQRASRTLLLISLDGVHPDYLGRGDTPQLDRLASEGVQAEWMRPSYPSLTFPNHFTLVTGLRPDHHGVVHNTMKDPELGEFFLSNRDAVGNGLWWQAEPLWVTAERAGLPTATMFWPGSEAAIAGVRPGQWKPFDAGFPIEARVDQVLGWLAEPAATRPRLMTLYFEHADTAGHNHGPDSNEVRAAMREMDTAVGRLREGIAQLGREDEVDIVVVSDHGMARVAPDQVVVVEDMVSPDDATPVTFGQVVGFAPVPGREAAAEAALLGEHEHHACWRKGELPARWHYGSHPRIPAIVCQMQEGWDAIPREYLARRPAGARGSHGFDPALASMRAIFIANGPSFRRGLRIPAIDNVDVYPLLAQLLGVAPRHNDGDPQALLPALRPDAAPATAH